MGLIPSCLWSLSLSLSLRIFPSLLSLSPVHALRLFYRDAASSALLQLVNEWLNIFTYSRSHAFRYGRNNTNSGDNNRTHDFRTSRCAGYLLNHSGITLHYIEISMSTALSRFSSSVWWRGVLHPVNGAPRARSILSLYFLPSKWSFSGGGGGGRVDGACSRRGICAYECARRKRISIVSVLIVPQSTSDIIDSSVSNSLNTHLRTRIY